MISYFLEYRNDDYTCYYNLGSINKIIPDSIALANSLLIYCPNVYTLSFRIPGAGSYPNIESRESPVGGSCNYVNETSGATANAAVAAAVAAAGQATVSTEPKLIYKKSVFKKKSTSSTATVSRISCIPYKVSDIKMVF